MSTQIREYIVPDDIGEMARPMQINIPMLWLRKHCLPGDKIGLFQRPDDSSEPGFEISIIKPQPNGSKS